MILIFLYAQGWEEVLSSKSECMPLQGFVAFFLEELKVNHSEELLENDLIQAEMHAQEPQQFLQICGQIMRILANLYSFWRDREGALVLDVLLPLEPGRLWLIS